MSVTVTFPQSGELQFLCKYHTAQGMNGLLRVDEPDAPAGP
jgi:plastocyanin